MNCAIEDVVRMYFKTDSEHHLAWSLIEMSLDETGECEIGGNWKLAGVHPAF